MDEETLSSPSLQWSSLRYWPSTSMRWVWIFVSWCSCSLNNPLWPFLADSIFARLLEKLPAILHSCQQVEPEDAWSARPSNLA